MAVGMWLLICAPGPAAIALAVILSELLWNFDNGWPPGFKAEYADDLNKWASWARGFLVVYGAAVLLAYGMFFWLTALAAVVIGGGTLILAVQRCGWCESTSSDSAPPVRTNDQRAAWAADILRLSANSNPGGEI